MPGFVVNVASNLLCTHAGKATATAPSPRVSVMGSPVVTMADVSTVAGCPFTTPGGNPMPCVAISWLSGTTRVLVGGVPALVASSTGLCAPNGTPPAVVVTQARVNAQ